MPTCKHCGHYGASADFRRSPGSTDTWVCKDKIKCKQTKEKK